MQDQQQWMTPGVGLCALQYCAKLVPSTFQRAQLSQDACAILHQVIDIIECHPLYTDSFDKEWTAELLMVLCQQQWEQRQLRAAVCRLFRVRQVQGEQRFTAECALSAMQSAPSQLELITH